jgi:hypothetical protein
LPAGLGPVGENEQLDAQETESQSSIWQPSFGVVPFGSGAAIAPEVQMPRHSGAANKVYRNRLAKHR